MRRHRTTWGHPASGYAVCRLLAAGYAKADALTADPGFGYGLHEAPTSTTDQTPCVILVTEDLSCPATDALRQAHAQAVARGSRLRVCGIQPDGPVSGNEDQRLLQRAQHALGPAVFDLDACVLSGHPETALASLARARSAGLIVIAANDHATIFERALGTVAERVVRASGVPVLVVRPPFGLRVLVATDLTTATFPAIAAGAREASRRNVPLTVVHCMTEADHAEPARVAAAHAALVAATNKLDVIAELAILPGAPVEVVVRACGGVAADLLVIATEEPSGIQHLVGTMAELIAGRAPCSVLVVRRAG